MIKARVDLESRREEPGEASELMTMEIPLLDELWPGGLRHQTKKNGKLVENHCKKSKLMPHSAVDSRISQFSKALCQKMAHMKITMDWILMNQPNISVRLVPKSKHKFPVIVIWWENPLFRYFILLSDLPSILMWGKYVQWANAVIPAASSLIIIGISAALLVAFQLRQGSLHIFLVLKNTRAWLALDAPRASSAL